MRARTHLSLLAAATLVAPAALAITASPAAAGPAAAADRAAAAAALVPPDFDAPLIVDLAAPRHPISPEIYGMNFADEALAEELGLPVRRWGGNATTRYDFATDTTNRGSDWYFENVPGSADPANLPDGSETDVFVEQDRRTGTDTILSVPLIGWKPKARDFSCGFSIAKYGPQQGNDAQWRPDCGNGVKPDGTFVTGNDPHDTSAEAGAGYVTDWLEHLTGKYGTAANGGVRFYNFDNEPDIWHATHRDVHPAGASYDELRDRTYEIGAAVKAADPGAKTLGPVGWGWNSLFLSGHDQETCNRLGGSCWGNPPDRAAHGGVPFGEWYLARMREYEQEHGVRLLDYYDNHWYPQGSGVAFGNGNDPATNALRLRSTRNLWDPTYVDESWINDTTRLIPRMKEMVAANYPGTKTAITEYNWGALDHINGALAQAEVLGIFGREGLDLATLWAPPRADQPGAYAFRMFRNFDGQGGRFGDMSVKAVSSAPDRLSIYAAQTPGQPLTVVVLNKTAQDVTTQFTLRDAKLGRGPREAWHYAGADLDTITRSDLFSVPPPPCAECGAYDPLMQVRLPANSITTMRIDAVQDTSPPAVPGPATTKVRSTRLLLDWAPSLDDAGTNAYEVKLFKGDEVVQTRTSLASSARFHDLTPGETYRWEIRAGDAAGNWSEWSSGGPVTLPLADVNGPTAPGKPVIFRVTPTGFDLTWEPSTGGAFPVIHAEVWLVEDGQRRRATLAAGADPFRVIDLQPEHRYGVQVRSFDQDDNASPFSPVAWVTTPAEPGACVATYRVTAQGSERFAAEVTVRNPGTTTLRGWRVDWMYEPGQHVDRVRGGEWAPTEIEGEVIVRNTRGNAEIRPGRSRTFTLTGFWAESNPVPTPIVCTSP